MAVHRLLTVLVSGGLFATVGCQTAEKTPNQKMADQLAAAQNPPGMWERMTGQRSSAPPPTPAGDLASMPRSKPGTPLKVETECEFAETAFAAAIDPQVTGSERDRRLDGARQQFARVLQREPKNGRALMGLAKVYAETGDREKAAQNLKAYFEVNPKDHKAAFDMAMIYGRKKEFDAAVAGCEYALALDPENREYRKNMGFFLALSGRTDAAVTALTHNRMMTEALARHNIAGLLGEMQQFVEMESGNNGVVQTDYRQP